MRWRTRGDDDSGLSMTPLIDVVLLLLIFYVVTTSFAEREIELQLPESRSSAVPEEKKKYTAELGTNGELALNGELVTIDQFDALIAQGAARDVIKSVEIRADRRVVHGRVVEVLGIVKSHGIDAVGIAVKQDE